MPTAQTSDYNGLDCCVYSPLSADFVDITLDEFVVDYGYARIDVSAVECFVGRGQTRLDRDAMLFFDASCTSFNVQPSYASLLLFFHRPTDSNTLVLLGLITADSYRSVMDMGFMTAGDINRWERVDEPQWDIGAGYYQPPAKLYPSDIDEVTALERALGNIIAGNERPLESGSGREIDSAVFAWLCVLASMKPRFRELLVASEQRALAARLATLSLDSQRARFARAWFDDMLRYAPAVQPRYAGRRYDADQPANTSYNAVAEYYRAHRPTAPSPSICFVGPVEYGADYTSPTCTQCNSASCFKRLPASRGDLVFGYAELPGYLSSALATRISNIITSAHTSYATQFAESIWFKVRPQEALLPSFRWPGVAKEQRSKRLRHTVGEAVGKFEQLEFMVRWLFQELAVPSFQLVDQRWRALSSSIPGAHRRQVPGESVPDPKLANYNELVSFAFLYWPPCLAKLVVSCNGPNHLHYDDRRRVSALLKRFGYSEQTAGALFHLLFSETNVERGVSRERFLQTKRGLIIPNDYSSNKSENLGISCATFAHKGRCFFVDGCGDIEDLGRQQCRDHMNKMRASENLEPRPYPISSPYNYFVQRRKT